MSTTITSEINTELDVRRFAPGEKLRGRANWMSDAPVESAELRLFYYTEGKGTQDVEMIASETMAAPGAFEFQLPAGPYSFSGTLITLAWALELVIEPGAHVTRLDFVLSPSGEEIDLTRYDVPGDISRFRKGKLRMTGMR